jgi:UDP:flavonoid glycosyltransferase YjiC (YdhE family)
MKITLAPFGTSSDVLPMLALAKTLQSRGHVVTMCAPEEFRSRLYKAEVPMVSSGKTYREYLECEGDFEDATNILVKILNEDMATHFVALRDAAREADVVIGSRLQFAGPSLAEQRGAPYFYVVQTPGGADSDSFPLFGVPYDRAEKRRNKRIKEWNNQVLTSLNRERKIAHLPAVNDLFDHLYRSGSILLPLDPAFAPGKTLPNQIATGFWYLNDNIDLEADTESFLNEGKPPVYISRFRMKKQDQILSLCNALVSAGYRVVLGHGWNEFQETQLPTGVRLIDSLSFAHIFPKMAAIVHGGFADVSMHAIRSGIPQIIAPYTVEQTYWAEKCHSLGVSAQPVMNGDLVKLQQTIEKALSDRAIADRLKSQAADANQEGTLAAAEAIERIAQEHQNKNS